MKSTRKIEYKRGDKVGFCIFLEYADSIIYSGAKRRCGIFICKCGKEFTKMIGTVKGHGGVGCGCRIGITPHGQSIGNGTAEYRSWSHAKSRCECKSDKSYHRYGERGIKMCDRWRKSFESFLEDMGKRPSSKHSIDRIDNNGNYEPGNCRWATTKEQARNRRSSTMITYNGETRCVNEWSEILGFHQMALHYRIFQKGWSIEKAFTTPTRGRIQQL